MRRLFIVILALCALAGAACSGKGAKELYETAQFEEKQHNLEHARKLYEEIVAKHPQSEFAPQARERLETLKGAK
jgi:outer membrane protein assembly factor BamD (BamD/ComL family)